MSDRKVKEHRLHRILTHLQPFPDDQVIHLQHPLASTKRLYSTIVPSANKNKSVNEKAQEEMLSGQKSGNGRHRK